MPDVGGPVLIVEDDPSIRQLLRDALEHEGLECVCAGDGGEALRLIDHQRPSVVVLDMGLPLIDGAAVADGIRDRHGDQIPFIVVTASRSIEDAARRVRATAYMTKPFDIGDLVSAVRNALEPPPGTAPAEQPAPSPAS